MRRKKPVTMMNNEQKHQLPIRKFRKEIRTNHNIIQSDQTEQQEYPRCLRGRLFNFVVLNQKCLENRKCITSERMSLT